MQKLVKQKALEENQYWIIRNNGDTVLHLAAEHNQFEIFDYLGLSLVSINLNVQNDAGETPYMLAAREGHLSFL